MSVKEMIAYRREAEQYLGQDDHLYRIEWVSHLSEIVFLFSGER